MKLNKGQLVTLNEQLLLTFKKLSVYPMLILIVFFFIFHLFIGNWYKNILTNHLETEVENEMKEISNMQEELISNKLIEIENLTKFYSMNILDSIRGENNISTENRDRLGFSPQGVYYTKKDKEPSGIALFYSGYMDIGLEEIQKAHKLFSSEKFMINLLNSNPLISSIYFNTFDTLNIIYPYFDVLEHFPPKTDVTKFNFYYEANLENNPLKKNIWTDAYLDPAGHGWILSSLHPVYNGDFLEGVVGIDITIDTIIKSILNLGIPWEGYSMLINNKGVILAIPPRGESEWNVKELKNHTYNNIIDENIFKPDDFNIVSSNPNNEIVKHIMENDKGVSKILLKNKENFISWTTIPQTGWKLIILAERTKVLEPIDIALENVKKIEFLILTALGLFQLIFIIFIIKKAYRISNELSMPLVYIEKAFKDIENGNFQPDIPAFDIKEFMATSEELLLMGKALEENIKIKERTQVELMKYQSSLENLVEERTKNLKEANYKLEEINFELKKLQGELVHKEKLSSIGKLSAGISHEINNPIAFINSNLNTFKKYTEILIEFHKELSEIINESIKNKTCITENVIENLKIKYQIDYILEDSIDVFEESSEGIKRIREIIDSLRNFSNLDEEVTSKNLCNINESISSTLEILKSEYNNYINIELNLNAKENFVCNKAELNQALSNIFINAFYSIKEKHNGSSGLLKISTFDSEDCIKIFIEDNGKGMKKEVIDKIFDPFFTTKPIGAGTGLGLYITYDIIVNKIKGKIEVKSELEKFTEFAISIPISNT